MTPGTVDPALRARNLRTLALLAALFIVPLALAFFTYYGTSWRPIGSVNHGELISPPRPLPASALPAVLPAPAAADRLFRDKWTLVYVGDGGCPQECQQALYVMRQTRLSLNNDMTRVARVFLATAGCCARELLGREHPGLVVVDASGGAAQALLAQFPAADREHTLYVVDPLGNLMMRYDARANPRGLLDDLRKLLRLSHIG
ncbi:MAG: cytochrome oxidase assembly protein [Proteobacteria bacterium]|nr:cytochrome oxidase assembly protein [Pseudomonadota bacterium]